jgi:hypothetical protein
MSYIEQGPTFTWFRIFASNLQPHDIIANNSHFVTVFNVEADRVARVEVIDKGTHEVLVFGALVLIEGFRPE